MSFLLFVLVWWKHLGGSGRTQSATVLGTRCGWSRRPSLPLPCPNKAGGTPFTDGKPIFWAFPAVGVAPFDLRTGILILQLWEQLHILSVSFWLLFPVLRALGIRCCMWSELPGKWLGPVNSCGVKCLGKLFRIRHVLVILWSCMRVLRSVRPFMWCSFED